MPLIYICFTIFMFLTLSPFMFFLHTLFLVSYAYFYYEDFKQAFGVD